MAQGMPVSDVAKAVHRSRRQINRWMNEDDHFAEHLNALQERVVSDLQDHLDTARAKLVTEMMPVALEQLDNMIKAPAEGKLDHATKLRALRTALQSAGALEPHPRNVNVDGSTHNVVVLKISPEEVRAAQSYVDAIEAELATPPDDLD